MFTTLAGTFKDITESPYFPKMAFKKIPSSKSTSFYFFSHHTDSSLVLVDGYVDTRIMRASHANNPTIAETTKKRSLPNIFDLPSKLDFTTLQAIAHQTGLVLFLT